MRLSVDDLLQRALQIRVLELKPGSEKPPRLNPAALETAGLPLPLDIVIRWIDLLGALALCGALALGLLAGDTSAEFTTIRERLIKIAARVIEHIARIRIQLPTSCPEGALFRAVAFSLLLSGP